MTIASSLDKNSPPKWALEAIHELVYDTPLAPAADPELLPQSEPLEPVRIEREGRGFFDLEFYLWLQANFDSIVAQLPQWKEEYERNHVLD